MHEEVRRAEEMKIQLGISTHPSPKKRKTKVLEGLADANPDSFNGALTTVPMLLKDVCRPYGEEPVDLFTQLRYTGKDHFYVQLFIHVNRLIDAPLSILVCLLPMNLLPSQSMRLIECAEDEPLLKF